MDDLDHSISIVEYEWMSFYDECEECCLLLPSKADVDNSSLSDSEESWSQEHSEQCDALQTTAARTGPELVHLALEHGPCFAEFSQVNQKHTDGEGEDQTAVWEEKGSDKGSLHTRLNLVETPQCSEEDVLSTMEAQKENEEILKMVNYGIATNETLSQRSDPNDSQCSTDDGAHETLSDLQRILLSDTVCATTTQEVQRLPRHKADRDMNDRLIQCAHNAEKTLCGKDRSFLITKEKERWFVTVNVSPLRRKRRKKKKASRTFPPCGGMQKPTPERRSEVKMNQSEVESGNDSGPCETSQPHQGASAAESSDGIQIPVLTDTKPIHEDSSLSDSELCSFKPSTLETCPLSEAAPQSVTLPNSTLSKLAFKGQDITVLDVVKSEDFENGQGLCLANICNSRHQTAMLPNAVILKSASRLQYCQSFESIESMEFKSAEDFSSSNSSDCESYASAPDTPEDTWPIFKDHRSENKPEDLEQRSRRRKLLLSTPCDLLELSEMENVPHTDDVQFPDETLHVHSAKHLSHDIEYLQDPMPLQSHGCKTEANGECMEAYTEPALACLPVEQSDSLTLENNSADKTVHLTSQPSDSKQVELCSMTTDQPQSPSVCDPTAGSVPDSQETYAESLGPCRPVFAMSAFWDEMEKLTIRDILQLRESGELPSRKALTIHDTARPHDDDRDMKTDTGPLWSDTPLVDPSDIADSDYFTNPDDSQPDRSSCDVSVFSDLDEEYCQLLGGGQETGTDLLDPNLHTQSPAVSPPTRDSTKNTPPANEGTREEGSLDVPHSLNCFSAGQTAHESGIQKSKSMHNIQTLYSTHKGTPFEPILENGDERSPCIKDPSLQMIPVIMVNNVLVDGTFSTMLSNPDILDEDYRISLPEVLGYFYENKTEDDFGTVSNYDDQSLSSLCDGITSSRYGSKDGLLSIQASQWREEKPIPIFTCSGHSLRALTFPEADYLIRSTEIHVDPDMESHGLPIWAVPHAPCPGVYPVLSSAAADEALFNNRCWSSWFIRNIRLPDSGSSWSLRSWPWVFPIGAHWTPFRDANAVHTLTPQRGFASFPNHLVRKLAADQQMLKLMPTSVSLSDKDGLFSTLKQSDMCLLCIAVASWVLRSTDPHAADSWKAALLANVSAISAIQYLRHYVLRRPAKDGQ
ncbi:uncharacterized protein LOC130390660 isoform X1 [Gadus chalcogrammus]|nr:uncharacterized protein LOC130390660 isoform X1 [Gadus chalcogrammus]